MLGFESGDMSMLKLVGWGVSEYVCGLGRFVFVFCLDAHITVPME